MGSRYTTPCRLRDLAERHSFASQAASEEPSSGVPLVQPDVTLAPGSGQRSSNHDDVGDEVPSLASGLLTASLILYLRIRDDHTCVTEAVSEKRGEPIAGPRQLFDFGCIDDEAAERT